VKVTKLSEILLNFFKVQFRHSGCGTTPVEVSSGEYSQIPAHWLEVTIFDLNFSYYNYCPAFCHLDALAMVKTLEVLKEVCKIPHPDGVSLEPTAHPPQYHMRYHHHLQFSATLNRNRY
jgi:hypothetical protein